ncbi:MAG: hypothetical protein ABIL45_04415 [candidate division WOR-3 bacterium]
MILNLKIVKGKYNYNRTQAFQKYSKNYSSDISFIVVLDKGKYSWEKGEYTWEALRLCFYYKNEDRILDIAFPDIEFKIKIPFNLNLYIESKNKGYEFYYSIEGDKIVLREFARILKYKFLEYYYYYSESKFELFLYIIQPFEKIQKEKVIPYLIYKPIFIYSIIAILFTKDILYGSAG